MKLLIAELPKNGAELAAWLEGHLVGLDLQALVAELSAVHGDVSQDTLEKALENRMGEVMESGLSGLSSNLLGRLLRQPTLLLELQERVIESESPYWNGLATSKEMEAAVARGERRLRTYLKQEEKPRLRVRPVIWIGVAAAAGIAGLMIWNAWSNDGGSSRPGWGWARSGALAQGGTDKEYFARLADEADEWFRNKPDSRDALAQRIREMRQGCTALLAANHRPLSPDQKTALNERCRAWDKKFAQQLEELAAGADVEKTRSEADATVEKLVRALRNSLMNA
jgi:hypothetical protein